MSGQLTLFDSGPILPEGFRYQPDLISAEAELGLVDAIRDDAQRSTGREIERRVRRHRPVTVAVDLGLREPGQSLFAFP